MDIQHERFTAGVDGATSARVKLSLPIGETRILAGSDPNTLIDADMAFLGEMKFAARGETEKLVNLGPVSGAWMEWLNPANWNFGRTDELDSTIRLNSSLPTDLDIHGGLGESKIDLTGMNLSALEIAGGVGEIKVRLPAGKLEARLQVGVGELDITLADQAATDLKVRGGVGEVTINLPAEAAARVEARTGIGELRFSSRFQQVSGSASDFAIGKNGVWETPNFAAADHKITIQFDGGIGELKVR